MREEAPSGSPGEEPNAPAAPLAPGDQVASAVQVARFRAALFERTPRAWVTTTLIAINVALFVAMVASGVSLSKPTNAGLIAWGADYGPLTTTGQPWRLLTNTFIHIGVLHVVLNMVGLWFLGTLIERLLGSLGFAVSYLLSGLCGSLLSTWWSPLTVSAGASGAIFGIFGALVAYLLRHRGQIPREILVSLRRFAISFVVLNVAFGLKQKGLDVAAHLGGLGGGLLAGLFVGRPIGEAPAVARRRAALVALVGTAAIALGAAALPHTFNPADELTAFQAVNDQAIAAYNDGVRRLAGDAFKDEDLARLIDEQVLPPWRQFQRRLVLPGHLGRAQDALWREIATYMKARETAWAQISRALRAHDAAAMAGANDALNATLDTLDILNGREPAALANESPSGLTGAGAPAPDRQTR